MPEFFLNNFSDFLGEVQVNYPDFVWPLMALIFVIATSAIFIILLLSVSKNLTAHLRNFGAISLSPSQNTLIDNKLGTFLT